MHGGQITTGEIPLSKLKYALGIHSIEFLSGDLLLRGGYEGGLEFIHHAQIGAIQYSPIDQLHSDSILDIQSIVKNVIATTSVDGYLKVIDPIPRKCYMKFKKGKWLVDQ